MKRYLALILSVAMVFAVFAGPAAAKKKKKKKKPTPVAVEVPFYIVWDGTTCALSVDPALGNPEEACADPFAGAASSMFGTGPWAMPALDGLPLTLDASKPIKGVINVESYYALGLGPDVMGVGEAELAVSLTGTSGGEEIVIGELTSDPYMVTPASADYVVEFEIQPDAALDKKVFEGLTLGLELTGNQMFHGVIPADGTSTLTLGAFTLP